MRYSEFRGYKFSKLTLGTVALGLDYGISNDQGKPQKEESFEILSTALKLGVNTIDTARDYGDAELLTGDFLNQAEDRKKLNLVTKFRIIPENLFDKDKARAQIYDSINSSLHFLGLNQIPVCLFHKTMDQPMEEVMKILPFIYEDLKNDGLIDLAGISLNHPDEAKFLLGQPIMDAVQIPVNVFDQRMISNGMLNRLNLENKIVFARSVFLQGLFFMPPENLKGNLADAKYYIEKLRDLAAQAEMSIAQLAFSYVDGLEGITSIVFGATNPQQVKDNINLLHGNPVPVSVKQAIEELFTDLPEIIITPGLWAI